MDRGEVTEATILLQEPLSYLKYKAAQGLTRIGEMETISEIFGTLGEKDSCLTWMEKAINNGDLAYRYYELSPMYDKVREDPRFQELLRGIKEKVARMREQVLAEELVN